MKEHEWITEERETNFIGSWTINRCINCGAICVDLFRKKNPNKPKRIRLEGANINLPDDCDEALRITQEYWERQGSDKQKYKKYRELYKNEKKKYSK